MLDGIATSSDPWSVLRRFAIQCGVSTIGVTGEHGRILGSVSDAEVLPTYSRTGRFAHRTNEILREFFHDRSGCYVDVGANIGLTTVSVAQNPSVKCIAIEPSPINFSNLTANVAINCPAGNVQLRQLAIFSRRDSLRLELSPENAGDNRLRLKHAAGLMGEEQWRTVEIEAAPLDDVITDLRLPLAVKIDVQGAEPFVFEGGPRTLAAADLIIAEWAPYWLARLGGDPTIVTSFLQRNFDRISLAEGEEGPVAAPDASAAVAERLLEMLHAHRDDPPYYVDIIARR